MPAFVVDANCMVAAVCAWHEHHAAARSEIERRLELRQHLTVPAHALAEAYAVLTRLPPPHRLSSSDAWRLLEANFVERANVVSLDASSYVTLIRRLATDGIAGGRTYDAIIGECARQAGAKTLLTFNRRHFDPPPDGVSIVDPAAER